VENIKERYFFVTQFRPKVL